MADLGPFPDVELALVALLGDLAATGTTTPPNLQSAMPFVRIARFGGAGDALSDSPLVSVDAFCALRADARSLAESVRQRLVSGPSSVSTDTVTATIDKATVATSPHEVPWSDDETVRRFTASYRVTVRR